MTFDKIEADMLTLHREDVPVLDYVDGCVETLAAEARERHIDVVLVNEHTSVVAPPARSPSPSRFSSSKVAPTGRSVFAVLPTDVILVDKFKVRVCRTTLSHALSLLPPYLMCWDVSFFTHFLPWRSTARRWSKCCGTWSATP